MISFFHPGSKWNIPPVKRCKSNLQHLDRYRSPKGSISPEYSPIQQEWNTPLFILSTLCAKTHQFPGPESFLMLQLQKIVETTWLKQLANISTVKKHYKKTVILTLFCHDSRYEIEPLQCSLHTSWHVLATSSVHKYKAPDSSPSPITIINQKLFIFFRFFFLQSAVCRWFCAGLAVYVPYVNPIEETDSPRGKAVQH